MEKNVHISMLFEYYGKLLTDKQANILDVYYNNDLSLREIAEIEKISPQGVRDTLKKAEKALLDYDNKLKLSDFKNRLDKIDNFIDEILENVDNRDVILTKAKKIKKIIQGR